MAHIYGQTDSLKRLLKVLEKKGIRDFHSVSEMQNFIDLFDYKKQHIATKNELQLYDDIENLKQSIEVDQNKLEDLRSRLSVDYDHSMRIVNERKARLNEATPQSSIRKIVVMTMLAIQDIRHLYLKTKFLLLDKFSIGKMEKRLLRKTKLLTEFTESPQEVINKRCLPEFNRLNHIKKTLEELNPLIAGAVGEELVVEEIKKLSDDYILINGFTKHFKTPIYNRNSGDKIYSISIDHLLISKSGIFILETKNWSQNSIDSPDLRSPVEQIQRFNYAIYCILKRSRESRSILLNKHHWGQQKVPIRNVIVMINSKPKGDFYYVKVKTLKELNSYMYHHERIFDDKQLQSMTNYFLELQEA
jgi:hypothetical protein